MDSVVPIIIDNGSYEIKAGFSNIPENQIFSPKSVFPTVINSLTRNHENLIYEKHLYGDYAHEKRELFKLDYPMDAGNIVNWDR